MSSSLRSVLNNSSFRNLWLGQIFSQLAVNMMAFVLTIRVYEQTRSNIAVSLLVLAIGLPALLLGPVAGVFVDRWQKRSVLFWCNLLRALLVGLLVFFREYLFVVYVVAVLVTIITQFFIPAEAPLIPRFIPENLLITANSLFTFTYYGSVAAGFISSGPFLRLLGSNDIFSLMGALLFLAALFVYRIPKEKEAVYSPSVNLTLTTTNFKNELVEVFSYLKHHKKVIEAILLFTASQAFLTTLAALSPGFADRVLLIDLTDASVIIMGPAVAGLIVGSLILAVFSGRRQQKNTTNIGIIGVGLILFILSLFVRIGNRPNLVARMESIVPGNIQIERLDVAMLLFFLLGAANAAVIVPLNATIQRETADNIRGRIYGVLSALIGGISILPVVGAGTFADMIGVGKTIFGLSIAVLLFGLYRIKNRSYVAN